MSAGGDRAALLRRLGLSLVLLSACARVVVTYDPLPGWGSDPTGGPVAMNGLGPAGSVLLAALGFAGLAMILAAAARAGERVPRWMLGLGAAGLLPVVYHGWVGPTASVENAVLGTAWAGAVACGLGGAIACRNGAERALVLGVCGGVVGPLVARALVQVYSEHPAVVEDFRARRDEILAGQGWTPGSAMARAYERRLMTPDASAWMAMSNVYASMLAGCAAVACGAVIEAWRRGVWGRGDRAGRYRVAGGWAALLCSLGGVVLAMPAGGAAPKGGIAAMLLGLGLVGLVAARGRLPGRVGALLRGGGTGLRGGGWIGIAVVVVALGAVAARGLVGGRIGELSLWFRWFYIEAAARIFAGNPLAGVGPEGFQRAYLVAKNPLNPEQVSSPHSVLFEFAATLGVAGVAWGCLLLALALGAGRALLRPDDGADGDRAPVRWLVGLVALCAALSFAREGLPVALSVPGATGVLLVDGVTKAVVYGSLWACLALALASFAGGRWAAVGLAAAGLAVLAHSQIELTMTDVSASAWAMLLLGAGSAAGGSAGRGEADPAGAEPGGGRRGATGAWAVGAGLAAVAVAIAAAPVAGWELSLRRASRLASEPITLAMRFQELASGGLPAERAAFVEDLGAALGAPVGADVGSLANGLDRLRLARTSEAADLMERAARSGWSASRPATRAAVRVRGVEAALRGAAAGGPDRETLGRAEALARRAVDRWPGDSRAWRQLAQIETALGGSAAALGHLLRAAGLDPHSPHLALEVAEAQAAAGDAREARAWSERALSADARMRLDPLAGLSDIERARAEELAGDP